MYKRKYTDARITDTFLGAATPALDEGNARPDQSSSPIPHTRGSPLGPVSLHSRKRILDVLWSQRRPSLRWGQEQRASW
jgi:hypothetical protein